MPWRHLWTTPIHEHMNLAGFLLQVTVCNLMNLSLKAESLNAVKFVYNELIYNELIYNELIYNL